MGQFEGWHVDLEMHCGSTRRILGGDGKGQRLMSKRRLFVVDKDELVRIIGSEGEGAAFGVAPSVAERALRDRHPTFAVRIGAHNALADLARSDRIGCPCAV